MNNFVSVVVVAVIVVDFFFINKRDTIFISYIGPYVKVHALNERVQHLKNFTVCLECLPIISTM